MRHSSLREALWLVKNGVPFNVSFELDDITRTGWSIIFSEFEGQKFNFDSMGWEKRE